MPLLQKPTTTIGAFIEIQGRDWGGCPAAPLPRSKVYMPPTKDIFQRYLRKFSKAGKLLDADGLGFADGPTSPPIAAPPSRSWEGGEGGEGGGGVRVRVG